MTVHRLGPLDEIPENDARGYTVENETGPRKLLVVRWRGEIHAYLNRCPHAGTPLDWVPDMFFDRSRTHLICQTHGALFEPADGFCVEGPCAGDTLTAIEVQIEEGGEIFVRL